jgi:hypothetical protein
MAEETEFVNIQPNVYAVVTAGDTTHTVTYLHLTGEKETLISHHPVIDEGMNIAHEYAVDATPEIVADILQKTTNAIIQHYANLGVEVEVDFPNE